MKRKLPEKGQALILVALAAIGLFAFAALAIDGSRMFSDKRHAQNAADTAALAGASHTRAARPLLRLRVQQKPALYPIVMMMVLQTMSQWQLQVPRLVHVHQPARISL